MGFEDENVEIDESVRHTGTVKKFYDKRGFGFIEPSEGGKALFAHWEQISSQDKWPKLEVGSTVEYHLGKKGGETRAFNITLEEGLDVSMGPDKRKLSKFRTTGTVRFFHVNGYGFIQLDKAITWPQKLPAGEDIYVSREELDMDDEGPCNVRSGMELEFNVFQQEGKDTVAAANVTAPGGGSIEGVKLKRSQKGSGKGKGNGKGNGKSNGKSGGKNQSRDSRDSRKGSGKSGGENMKITPIKKTIAKVKTENRGGKNGGRGDEKPVKQNGGKGKGGKGKGKR